MHNDSNRVSDRKRVAIAALAGALKLVVLEAITYAAIIPDLVEANRVSYDGLYREQPALVPLLLFNLLWATLLTCIFEYWTDIRTLIRGTTAGAVCYGTHRYRNQPWIHRFLQHARKHIPDCSGEGCVHGNFRRNYGRSNSCDFGLEKPKSHSINLPHQ